MKSRLKVFSLAVVTSFTLITSTPSHAIVGIVSWNPLLMGAGLTAASVGTAGGMGFGALTGLDNFFAKVVGYTIGGAFAAVGMVGMIVLDGEDQAGITFTELDKDSAKKLGLTEKERLSYNAEIDQLNFLASDVDESLSKMKRPTIEDSKKLWNSVKDSVRPESLSALRKVMGQWYK